MRLLRRTRPLHHQLIGVVVVLVVLAVVVLGGYLAIVLGGTLRDGAVAQASTLARNVAISSSNPLLTDSLDVLEELARRSADFDAVMEIRIVSPRGQSLAHVIRSSEGETRVVFDPPRAVLAVPDALHDPEAVPPVFEAPTHLVVWHPILAGALVGWVRVDYSTQSLEQLRGEIWRSALLVAVLAMGGGGFIVVRVMARPMQELRQATEFAVGLNEVRGQQWPVSTGTTEIEALGGALNEASARLNQQMLSLQERNERLGAIFSLSRDGLVTFDRMGRIQFANEAFVALTGLTRAQVEGASVVQLDQVLQQCVAPDRPFAGVAACFAPEAVGQPVRLHLRHPQLGERVLTLLGQRSDSAAVSLVLYVCDVTQQHQLDQIKSDFLSLAAHELRTPMTSIFGYTELILTREMKPEQVRSLIQRVHTQSQVMMSILNELLDLSRIEAKRGSDFNWQCVDLQQEVSLVVPSFSPPHQREPVVVVPTDRPMPVRLDCQQLSQMLFNVLSNAYKYSPGGGGVSVHFLSEERDGAIRHGVAVQDQGMGMRPDDLARMGERFFRADKSGHIPGSGLGVSIVKELAELMGGQLCFSSEWGKGTTVTLWFPAASQA